MPLTRRQHYVWKHYLTAWAVEKNIRVLAKDGRAFATNPINVAVARDFYRLPVLTEADEAFVHRWIESAKSPEPIKQLNREGFQLYAIPSRVRRALGEGIHEHPEVAAELEAAEIQLEERFHSGRETASVPALEMLRHGSSAFWSNEDEALNFSYFIGLQLMRTKRMRERYLSGFPEHWQGTAERTWPLLRSFAATGMGWSIFAQRNEFTFAFLTAPVGSEFITGDQPVFNIVPPTNNNDVALFYPVGPTTAVIFKHPEAPPTFDTGVLTAAEVTRLNAASYGYAYEMAFGRSAAALANAEAAATEAGYDGYNDTASVAEAIATQAPSNAKAGGP